MKKELVIPEPWKHHAIQACISSIDMHFYVDVLTLTQAEDGAIEINIVLLPNNRLGFAIKQGKSRGIAGEKTGGGAAAGYA